MAKRPAEDELPFEKIRMVATAQRTSLAPDESPQYESPLVREYHHRSEQLRGKVSDLTEELDALKVETQDQLDIMMNAENARIEYLEGWTTELYRDLRQTRRNLIKVLNQMKLECPGRWSRDTSGMLADLLSVQLKEASVQTDLTPTPVSSSMAPEDGFSEHVTPNITMESRRTPLKLPRDSSDASDVPPYPLEQGYSEVSDLKPFLEAVEELDGDQSLPERFVSYQDLPAEDRPPSKRSVTLKLPPGPFWLVPAMQYLKINGEEQYNAFLKEYGAAEALRMPTGTFSFRPQRIADWASDKNVHRFDEKGSPEMTREFALSFPAEVWTWWFNIQPQGRVLRKGKTAQPPEGKRLRPLTETPPDKRVKLRKWGLKGWVSIFVALKWWNLSIAAVEKSDQEDMETDWRLAVEEMRATFTVLTSNDK
ncbi:hypothetical protein V5O48_011797 [Marasmius crinis-equi]|uniref:Uncharacterized protein n=1 Tax=Marasmius crinis-equi TaxID=585013 RepID=A0ABR3F4I8_9AGAR